MKKAISLLFVGLLLYTIIHVVFFFSDTGEFYNMIKLEADPLVITLFNLSAIFGLSFLIFHMKFRSLNRLDLTALILGFGLGAFIIIPLLIKKNVVKDNNEKWLSVMALIGLILAITLLGFGLILGNYQLFINAFMQDSFVHIMAINYITLTILSVIMSKSISRHFYLAGNPACRIPIHFILRIARSLHIIL